MSRMLCRAGARTLAAACLWMLPACEEEEAPAPERADGTTAEDLIREGREAGEAAAQFTSEKIEEFRVDMRERLRSTDERIDELEQRASELDEEARARLRATVEDLRARGERLTRQLEEAQADSEDAWQDVKGGLNEAWRELDQAVSEARDRYGDPG